jgi:hypothetical protein
MPPGAHPAELCNLLLLLLLRNIRCSCALLLLLLPFSIVCSQGWRRQQVHSPCMHSTMHNWRLQGMQLHWRCCHIMQQLQHVPPGCTHNSILLLVLLLLLLLLLP